MLEIAVGIGVCIVMAKIAGAEDQSTVIWFCITFALCLASMSIPLPFLRFLIAGAVSFAAMTGYKVLAKR